MPYTHGHAVVNVWILGRCVPLPAKDHRLWVPILLGGMIPDLPLLIFICMEVPKYGNAAAFDEIYFEQPWQDVFGYFHSIPITLFTTIVLIGVAVFVLVSSEPNLSVPREVPFLNIMGVHFLEMTGLKKTSRSSAATTTIAPMERDFEQQGSSSSLVSPTHSSVRPGDTNGGTAAAAAAAAIVPVVVFWSQAAWLTTASMFLHALADLGLHTYDAHSQFLPFSRVKIHSKISYYDVTEYAWVWAPMEFLLVLMACRFLLKQLSQRWCRVIVYLVLISYIVILVGTCISAISLVL